MDAKISETRKATEYLANERTFLAWMRTSLSVISLGFVVAKFGVWLHELGAHLTADAPPSHSAISLPIGIGMMAMGGVLAVLAAWHYHVIALAIDKGEVRAHRGLIILMACFVASLAVVMIAYMLFTAKSV